LSDVLSVSYAKGKFKDLPSLPKPERGGEYSQELCYHHFRDRNENRTTPLKTLQDLVDIRDEILQELHKAANGHLFYERIHLEDVFLLWRYLVIYEGKAAPCPPGHVGLDVHLNIFNPFSFYRDILESLLYPYWQEKKTPSSVRAEHLRKVIAGYFAQLLCCHPCFKFYCMPVGHQPCICCGKGRACCDSTDFPQKNCPNPISPLLLAAFADCLWRQIQVGNNRLAEGLLAEVMNAFQSIHPSCDNHPFALYFFCSDFLYRQAEKNGTSATKSWVRSLLKKTYERDKDKLELTQFGMAFDRTYLKAYITTLKREDLPTDKPSFIDVLSIDLTNRAKQQVDNILLNVWTILRNEVALNG